MKTGYRRVLAMAMVVLVMLALAGGSLQWDQANAQDSDPTSTTELTSLTESTQPTSTTGPIEPTSTAEPVQSTSTIEPAPSTSTTEMSQPTSTTEPIMPTTEPTGTVEPTNFPATESDLFSSLEAVEAAPPAPFVTKQVVTGPKQSPYGPSVTAAPGNRVSWEIRIEGEASAGTVITLTDSLPAGPAPESPRCLEDSDGSVISCTITGNVITATYTVSGTGRYQFFVSVPFTVPEGSPGDSWSNTACARASTADGSISSAETCSDPARVTLAGSDLPAPVLSKNVYNASTGQRGSAFVSASPGDTGQWSFQVAGGAPIGSVLTITDALPAGLTYGTPQCYENGLNGTIESCSIDSTTSTLLATYRMDGEVTFLYVDIPFTVPASAAGTVQSNTANAEFEAPDGSQSPQGSSNEVSVRVAGDHVTPTPTPDSSLEALIRLLISILIAILAGL